MATSQAKKKKTFSPLSLAWLRFAVELLQKLHIQDRHFVYLWAIFVGILGACVALAFEYSTEFLQWILTGAHAETRVDAFEQIGDWRRIAVPVVGGLLAGLTLLFTHKFIPAKATEYMEAVSLGSGKIPVRPSLLRCLSAIFSISSGAAIGKEGPLVQTAAVAASTLGQKFKLSAPRLRLMVACGAAAGITAAFHAPLGACLFVSEIVLGTLSINILAPMLIASSTSFVLMHMLGKQKPIYEAASTTFGDINQVLLCIVLAIIAACVAKGWLVLLKVSRSYLNGKRQFLPLRLMLAGLFVGLLACYDPHVVGNGAEIIAGLVQTVFTPEQASIFLVLKIVAVAVVFGCGTVGGALTPSLMIGGLLGFLFSTALTAMGISGDHAVAYTMVGMAAFFTTAANAPLTSLVLVVEFSMAGTLIFPLILAVVCSHAMSMLLKAKSMYYDSLTNGPRTAFDKHLGDVSVSDIARTTPAVVEPGDKFGSIATILLKNPGENVFVEGKNKLFLGTIIPEDVMTFAKSATLADTVIAIDVMREDIPVLSPEMGLPAALGTFTASGMDSLAVVHPDTGKISGIVSKGDLYQVISEIMKREKLK